MSEDDNSSEGGGGFLSDALANVPDSWRAKLARGLLQILVGTEHGAAMYSEGRRRLDHIEGRSLIDRRLAEVVAEQAAQDSEIVERYKARFLGDLFRSQENLEAVVTGAVGYLPALPPPDGAGGPQSEDDGATAREDASDNGPPPLDADWAASFTAFAEKATSEALRDRLSRILAGEVTRPGSFPRAAVRALVELEQTDLQAMQAVLPFVFHDALYPTAETDRRPTYDELIPLVDAGLVLDPNAGLHRYWKLNHDSPAPSTHVIVGKTHGIAVTMQPGGLFKHDIIPLTRAGQVVVDLLGRPDERIILRTLAQQAEKVAVTSILLGGIESGLLRVAEYLYPLPPVPPSDNESV